MVQRVNEKLLPGFPRNRKFQTKEEVDAYFASDKIQCLLCRKWFKRIGGTHLTRKHGITADDYREMYGLPWRRGLTGKLNHEQNVQMGKRTFANRDKELMLERLHSVKASPPRPPQPFMKDMISRMSQEFCERARKYRREDFEAILERMRDQRRTLGDVCNDPDMPSRSSWTQYANKHPEMKITYRETIYSLPYSLQARIQSLSPQFSIDCRDMRARGMTMGKIAEALGVNEESVRRILHDAPGGFRPMDRSHLRKWRLEDYEAVLDRMRKQQRYLKDVCGDPDLPSITQWLILQKNHPELKKKIREVMFTFPYPLQLKAGWVSPRFGIDCQRMKARGMVLNEVAAALGVSIVPVRRLLHDRPGGFGPLDNRSVRKWRPRDYEAILIRMRKQKRLLKDVCRDPDLPSVTSLYKYERRHPEFKEKVKQTFFSLPYSLQVQARVISPQLKIECQRMNAKGISMRKIAHVLGISPQSVKRILQKD